MTAEDKPKKGTLREEYDKKIVDGLKNSFKIYLENELKRIEELKKDMVKREAHRAAIELNAQVGQ